MDINLIIEITFAFLSNILILMGLAVVYSVFPIRLHVSSLDRKIILGIVGGVIGVSIMTSSYQLAPGLVFDARAVAMTTIGIFLGTVPTIVAGVFMSAYRIYLGGAGVLTGVLWIAVSGILGLLYRHLRLKPREEVDKTVSWVELYLYSLLVQVVMIVLLFTLQDSVRSTVLEAVAIPILVIYPIGGLLISSFMLNQRKKFFLYLSTYISEKQYRNLFSKSRAVQMLLETNGNIVDINDQFIKTYGYSKEDVKSMNISDINVLTEDEVNKKLQAVLDGKDFFQFQHRKKNGDIMDVEIHTGTILLENKQYILSTSIDVTKQLESHRKFFDADEKLKAIFQSVTEGLVITDENGHITLINDKAKEILDSKKDVIGKRLWEEFRIYSPTHKDKFHKIIMNALRNDKRFISDPSFTLVSNKLNDEKAVDFTVSPLNSSNNLNNGVMLFIRDVTLEKKSHDEIRFISQHDHLTKLYNRFYFEGELKRLNTKRQLPLSIILGDVNGLKLVNDSFSHLEGDQLLIEISKILKKACRHEDIIARWGGDEFVILLPQTSYANAQLVYDRIKLLCSESTYSVIKPSVSLGIATKTYEKKDIFDTLLEAETIMYREKLQEGKSMRSVLIETLENTLVEKSLETEEHATRMLDFTHKFGKHLKLSKEEINDITLVARLHDIGKIGVSNTVLLKKTKLTKKDWDEIHTHPEAGARIVSSIPELTHISRDILHHHEKWDGTGYPEKKSKEDIPYYSRIISIIDAFEVMTSGRIYRKAITTEKALAELDKCSGTQFDPTLVPQFIDMINGLSKTELKSSV